MNYAIDDGAGNRLTAGLEGEHHARQVAQQMADDRGEPVYLYQTGAGEETAETIEITPMAFFRPTHRITLESGITHEVMLDEEGRAYTRQEWDAAENADFEVVEGAWLLLGRPFAGTVEKL